MKLKFSMFYFMFCFQFYKISDGKIMNLSLNEIVNHKIWTGGDINAQQLIFCIISDNFCPLPQE